MVLRQQVKRRRILLGCVFFYALDASPFGGDGRGRKFISKFSEFVSFFFEILRYNNIAEIFEILRYFFKKADVFGKNGPVFAESRFEIFEINELFFEINELFFEIFLTF